MSFSPDISWVLLLLGTRLSLFSSSSCYWGRLSYGHDGKVVYVIIHRFPPPCQLLITSLTIEGFLPEIRGVFSSFSNFSSSLTLDVSCSQLLEGLSLWARGSFARFSCCFLKPIN